MGGITESLVKHTGEALVEFAGTLDEGAAEMDAEDRITLDGLLYSLLTLFRLSVSEERLVVPILQTYNLVLDTGFLARLSVDRHEHFKNLVHLSVRETRRSKDPKRIMAGVNVVVRFLSLRDKIGQREEPKEPDWKQMALANSLSFLLHGFPRVRKHAAEQLYLVLSARDLELQISASSAMDEDGLGQENEHQGGAEGRMVGISSLFADDIEPVLLETDWDQALGVLTPIVKDQLGPALEKYLKM